MIAVRYILDAGAQRHGDALVAGSPLRVFRLTDAGIRTVDALARGEPVADSALIARLLEAGAIHPRPRHALRFGPDAVTIVVPSFGRPSTPSPAGALVVDDGSVPAIDGADIRLDTNRGPAAARNAGLAQVETPLVAFVDADVTLPPDWLDGLLGHFDDERVALVAPRVGTAMRVGGSALDRYEARHSPLDLGPDPARIRQGSRVSYVPAAAILCRTDVVTDIGGFDESLRFGEDVDLVWRLDRAGWRLRYEPSVVVRHEPRASWTSWFRQRRSYGSSAAPLARRHPGALAPIRMSGWSLTAWVLGATRRPWLGAALGTATAIALIPKLPSIPPTVSFRLAAGGNLRAGAQLANAVRRVWWPLLLLASPMSSVARRALVASFLASRHPITALDDIAYSIGVWAGMIAEREPGPATPRLTSWPGRSANDRSE